jgi:hypothetical protein
MVASLVDALDGDLRQHGHQVEIIVARPNEEPPIPRIEVQVIKSRHYNGALHGAGQLAFMFGAVGVLGGEAADAGSAGTIRVECYVVSPSNDTDFSGRLSGSSLGTYSGRDAVVAGEDVGHAIASAVLR